MTDKERAGAYLKVAEGATEGPWIKGYWTGRCHIKHNEKGLHPGPPHCKYEYTIDTSMPAVSLQKENHILVAGTEDGWMLLEGDAQLIAKSRTEAPWATKRLLEALEVLENVQTVLRRGGITFEQSCDKVDDMISQFLQDGEGK